jgi:RHS repeat-associated protein
MPVRKDSYIKLIYLRSRYYAPETGRFITKDVWPGDYTRPLSLNGWNYVEGNPVNRTDPTGKYWWGLGQGLIEPSEQIFKNQNIHIRIQAIMMEGRLDQVHAEYDPLFHANNYTFPGAPGAMPIDLLDSVRGDVWEIKPWDDQGQAVIELAPRILAMNAASGADLLHDTNPVGMPYNWNIGSGPALWNPGTSFPMTSLYIGRDDTGWWDIYATQTQFGVIAWWKYKRSTRVPVPYPILLPDSMLWNERNTRPGWTPASAPETVEPPMPPIPPIFPPIPPIILPPFPGLFPGCGGRGMQPGLVK